MTLPSELPPRRRAGRMILTLFLHARDWEPVRLAGGREVWVPDHRRLALQAEAAKLHALFIADTIGLDLEADRVPVHSGVEPVTTLAYLAALTSRIGLVATLSTGFTEPFNLVRLIGSLDSLSRGRAGWNIVTSGWGESYFGRAPLPSHAARYRRAEEFVELAKALWESWGDDALETVQGGISSVRPGRIRRVAHEGEFFSLHGAADKPPSPQGVPVLVQAGSSADGIAFAARHAELVFTSQPFEDEAETFYKAVKAASPRPLVVPGVTLILAETAEEAAARQVAARPDLTLEQALRSLRAPLAGADLSGLGLDDLIPPERLPPPEEVEGRQTFYRIYRRRALEEKWTIRQLVLASDYHWRVADTPEGAARRLIARFEAGSADGFNIMPTDEESYRLIFARLIPLLQQAGYAQTAYDSPIFRENLQATAGRS